MLFLFGFFDLVKSIGHGVCFLLCFRDCFAFGNAASDVRCLFDNFKEEDNEEETDDGDEELDGVDGFGLVLVDLEVVVAVAV